ncbi:2-amino-4-hydroxy-6-hydroxymethyldihydropteridine diphosphokinase [Magnetospirillum molischianum]|uniref:2-amino-4-hydroxy-6-hydroxymethyldihydropteridine pyrophosphokinase n=1 Tax=Magnetospirillum molischianum DSM 120 TaxID=1150626 RepID=H8FPD6_MAGML|nr:2-amino-4-hydroxy-6-hydroxymethyldihydropteridine diphosphokinase [Magnetospirillum molischianum]CCG40224.1 7, 8-dihydro-6-hydroxymethylpterin-pyrophosphokinase [Magnetospirillum molischianum DSM 120]
MIFRTVHLGLGTNLGDRAANLSAALGALAGIVTLGDQSSVWETAPMHVLDQPAFLNMAVAATTDLEPLELLTRIKAIETRLGRVASVRFGPRLIDIDILALGEETIESEILTLPHPRLCERRFVLAPLAEIALGLVVSGRTVAALLTRLPAEGDTARCVGTLDSLAPNLADAL